MFKSNNRYPAQVSKEFLNSIKDIKEKAKIKGKEVSLTDITREIANLEEMNKIKKEVLNRIVYNKKGINIRFD